MDPNIEAALIGGSVTIAIGLIGWAWRLQEKIAAVREELGSYKLDVAEKYVSTQKLEDVETRMLRAVDELKHDLNKRLDDLLQTLRHPSA